MNKRFIFVVSTLFLSCGSMVFAAEGASRYAEAQRKLKEKFPEEYAEVQKLAAEDMSAAMKKLSELAKKGGINMRGSQAKRNSSRGRMPGRGEEAWRGGRRDGRSGGGRKMGGFPGMNLLGRFQAESKIAEKFPAEFAAAVKQMNEAEKKMADLAGKAGVELPPSYDSQIRLLQEKAPGAMAEIRKSIGEDPRGMMAAMAALRSLAEKHGVKLSMMPGNRGGQRGPGRGEGGFEREAVPPKRDMSRPSFSKLRAAFPEEMASYEELRRSDPGAARELLKKLSVELTKSGKNK